MAALQRRHRFLSQSAQAYDAGDREEAFRMSVDLRALLHYGSSPPLLHELGLIKKIDFADSCPEAAPERDAGTLMMWGGGLTVMQFTTGANPGEGSGKVVPRFVSGPDAVEGWTKYTRWWKSNLVVTSEDGKTHSRAFVVTQMANTEAAHSDAYLDGDYQALQPRPSMWVTPGPDGTEVPMPSDVAGASIRQITWEVLKTLEEQCADLLN